MFQKTRLNPAFSLLIISLNLQVNSLNFLIHFRARFSPLQTEREAANYMLKVIRDSFLNVR